MFRSSSNWRGVALAALTLVGCHGGAAPGAGSPSSAVAAAGPAGHPGDLPREADAGGKYEKLLEVVHAPEDEAQYGRFADYGEWGPGEWAGAMRPRGYWVYVAPRWYVWERPAGVAVAVAAQAPTSSDDRANVGGKYTDLIKTVDAPEDRETYGDFADYGAWGPGEWAGAMQPGGYWVYVAPKWYIWRATSR